MTPYDIAFMGEDGDLVGFGIFFILVKYTVDFVFWCDLVLQFRIAWHDGENKVVYEWKRQSSGMQKASSLLIFYAIGIIANNIELKFSGDSIAVLKLLRLLRLFKLAKLLGHHAFCADRRRRSMSSMATVVLRRSFLSSCSSATSWRACTTSFRIRLIIPVHG